MPLFLSTQTIKGAVDRLSGAATRISFTDFLIFKRALQISKLEARMNGKPEPDTVVTGTKSKSFVQSIEELTLRVPRGTSDPKDINHPYYLPFGSQTDPTHGYRSSKYPSNGSSDTVSRWQSRSTTPIVLVPGTSPKEYKFVFRSKKELEAFFIKGVSDSGVNEKPNIIDAAIWWFRFSDLESKLTTTSPTDKDLVKGFIEDTGLSDEEIAGLFNEGSQNNQEELNN